MVVRKFNITYVAMLIGIFPLVIFICSAINIKVDPAKTILNELKSSLNDFPLTDINFDEKCTNKYSGILYEFPGTKSGCSCVGIYNYYYDQSGQREVNPGSCSKNQTSNGCIKVPNYDSQKLYFWEGGRFCSKIYNSEINGYFHFLNNSVSKDENCQTGYKKCGKLDEMDNYLCIPNDEDCPINDIIITNEINQELEEENYSYINISRSSKKYFYYTKNSNKSVITKLKVAEGKLCMDRTYFYTDYPQYILDNNFKYYGCKHKINGQIYENIEALDNLTKSEFFLYSNLSLKKYFAKWRYDYPLYSLNANMSLYPKRYIGYNKKCLKKHGDIISSIFTEENINEINDIISYVLSKTTVIEWLSIIFFILSLLSCIFDLDSADYPFFIWIWAIINCILYIPLAIFLFKNLIKICKFREFPLCSTDTINTKIKLFHSSGNTLKTTTIISFIFLHLQLLFIVAIILIRYLIKYNEDDNEDNNSSKKNYNSDIDFQKPPEDPYYKCD